MYIIRRTLQITPTNTWEIEIADNDMLFVLTDSIFVKEINKYVCKRLGRLVILGRTVSYNNSSNWENIYKIKTN